MIVNAMQVPMVVTLVPRADFAAMAGSGEFEKSEFARQEGTPYGMRREVLLSPLGMPCTAPPWGTLAAVDMAAGTIRWQVPLGTTKGKAPLALRLGHAEHGRADRHRGRPGLHRRRDRRLAARLRRRDRRGALEAPPAGRRPGDPDDLPARATAGNTS